MTKDQAVTQAIFQLLEEVPERKGEFFLNNDFPETRRRFLNNLIISRPPRKASSTYLSLEKAILRHEAEKAGLIDCFSVPSTEYDHIGLLRGDILLMNADAVVIPTGESFLGSFSPESPQVDRFVHSRCGVLLRSECAAKAREITKVKPSDCILTSAYYLPAKTLIHVVTPKLYGRPNNKDIQTLVACYRNVLDLARAQKMKMVAIPPMAVGYHGYPFADAAKIAVEAVDEYMNDHPDCPNVIFVVADDTNFGCYDRILHSI